MINFLEVYFPDFSFQKRRWFQKCFIHIQSIVTCIQRARNSRKETPSKSSLNFFIFCCMRIKKILYLSLQDLKRKAKGGKGLLLKISRFLQPKHSKDPQGYSQNTVLIFDLQTLQYLPILYISFVEERATIFFRKLHFCFSKGI